MTGGTDVMLIGDLASSHLRRLGAGLRDAGLAVRIAGFEGDPIDGIPTHALGTRPATSDRRYGLAVPGLARLIRTHDPQIVHAHYLTSFGLMAVLAVRLARPVRHRPPLIQTVWGTDVLITARRSRLHRALGMTSLRAAALATGDSLDLADEVRRLAPRTPFLRFVFGPPQGLLTAARRPTPTIVSSRRLDPDTRIDLIIEGFRLAKDRSLALSDWRLVVAGSGRDAGRLRSMAEGRPDIEFVGKIDTDALHSLLLEAAAFVSVPRSDGTSASLLEAMAAGARPIVNDLPANREWVDDDVGSMLPFAPTAEDVAVAIERLPQRPDEPDAVRDRVRDAAWEHEVGRLIDAYGTIRPMRGSGDLG